MTGGGPGLDVAAALRALPRPPAEPLAAPEAARAFVRAHTERVAAWLCPELVLHLITPRCPLWHADERTLAALGLSEPFWGFAWAGGQALARHVLDVPGLVRGQRVLDFGAGSGLVALAAARAGAASVCAADVDPLALVAAGLNAEANGLSLSLEARDLVGAAVGADVVLAGDMTYDGAMTPRVLAWLAALSARGVACYVGDPGRGFVARASGDVPARLEEVGRVAAPADVDIGGRHLVPTSIWRVRA